MITTNLILSVASDMPMAHRFVVVAIFVPQSHASAQVLLQLTAFNLGFNRVFAPSTQAFTRVEEPHALV